MTGRIFRAKGVVVIADLRGFRVPFEASPNTRGV
jgi:hypothetical protein